MPIPEIVLGQLLADMLKQVALFCGVIGVEWGATGKSGRFVGEFVPFDSGVFWLPNNFNFGGVFN